MEKRDYKSEILDIIETKNWDKAKKSNDGNLYNYIRYHKDTDKNCKIIWKHIKTETRDHKSEISEIIETKDWSRAERRKNKHLYQYIWRHRNMDKNCETILEHISRQDRDFESEISEIIKTKDWDKARYSNDPNLYLYIRRHGDTNENYKTILEHIERKNYKSEILEIIRTKDWIRAKKSNNGSLYQYVLHHKDEDKNCKTIWEHIVKKTLSLYNQRLSFILFQIWKT